MGCPAICTSCGGGTCEIDCENTNCSGITIDCPDGFNCEVKCRGLSSCGDTQIVCPPEAECDLECREAAACSGATLGCGNGVCTVECKDSDNACTSLTVDCGDNRCAAICEAPVTQGPSDFNCGNSCDCTDAC